MNELDDAILGMYESICFEVGGHPDWTRLTHIFALGVRLVRITDSGIFEFDQNSYRADFERMIDLGEWPSVWEDELWRDTQVFGEMAHVLSAYETRRSRGGAILNRGVNSIQLFRDERRWRISSVLWRREGEHVTIPDVPPSRY